MSITQTKERTFSDFYLDESIPGHIFLKPSILVKDAYVWVFSPLSDKDCFSTLVNVISRIVLFIILPVLALLSALLIPIGLVCKGLNTMCPPSIPKVSVKDPTTFPVIPNRVPPPSNMIPDFTDATPPPSVDQDSSVNQICALSDELKDNIQKATELLKQTDRTLKRISFRKIDIEKVNAAEVRLIGSQYTKFIFSQDIQKGNKPQVLTDFLESYDIMTGRIESMQWHYHFHSKYLSETGEIELPGDGACLFASFVTQLGMSNVSSNQIQKVREETIVWISLSYGNDTELQKNLIHSLAEHYHTKIEKLEAESEGLRLLISKEGEEDKVIVSSAVRLIAIEHEMVNLQTEILGKISAAFGVEGEDMHFEAVTDIVSLYLQEMGEQKAYGGAAELYALCTIHQRCAKIYKKDQKITSTPYAVIHPEFETATFPALHFTHTYNHYNPYFPMA